MKNYSLIWRQLDILINEFDRKIILANERKRCDINELSDFIKYK